MILRIVAGRSERKDFAHAFREETLAEVRGRVRRAIVALSQTHDTVSTVTWEFGFPSTPADALLSTPRFHSLRGQIDSSRVAFDDDLLGNLPNSRHRPCR